MDQKYAEWLAFTQSESDHKISTLKQALRDTKAWAKHLEEMHRCRTLPFYSYQEVFTIHNANLVTEQDIFLED